MARPEARERDGESLDVNGRGDDAVADVGGEIVSERVGDMVYERSNGALAGGLGLEGESSKSNHSEASVLDLLGLELREVALGEAEGIKAGVAHLGV